jgi:hypothetical protein
MPRTALGEPAALSVGGGQWDGVFIGKGKERRILGAVESLEVVYDIRWLTVEDREIMVEMEDKSRVGRRMQGYVQT